MTRQELEKQCLFHVFAGFIGTRAPLTGFKDLPNYLLYDLRRLLGISDYWESLFSKFQSFSHRVLI